MSWKKISGNEIGHIPEVSGTWLQGEIETTYQKLYETFGEQSSNGDDFKVSCEWVIVFDCGTVATIYDWKRNPKYWEDGEHFTNVEDWHIGGKTVRAVELVQEVLDAEGSWKNERWLMLKK